MLNVFMLNVDMLSAIMLNVVAPKGRYELMKNLDFFKFKNLVLLILMTKKGRCRDIQHNDIQHNGIQHNYIQHNDIQHNETQHNI